jgi:serine/threonine protein kinase
VALPASIEGKYEVLAKLSEGGMGAVYKVRHTLLDEIRVVKVILPHLGHTAELSDRFLREARAASRLRHPNIAQILDFTVDDQGNELLVMEYIDGLTLKEILQRTGPPPLGLAIETARQALAALGYLHRRGFVHRDVSPDNLMLARDADGRPVVKLIDLGIAKAVAADLGRDLDGDLDASLTATGIFLGKPRYASPEQLEDRGPIDARSDLYSFGIVLYELLTGRSPINGRSAQELMAAHLLRPPLGFEATDPQGRVPQGLREIVLRLLAKRPEERIATAEEIAERLAPFAAPYTAAELAAVLAKPGPASVQDHSTRRSVQPAPPTAPSRPSEETAPSPPLLLETSFPLEPRKRGWGLAAAGLVTGALAFGALGLWIAGPRGPAEPKRKPAPPPPALQAPTPALPAPPIEPATTSPPPATDLTPPEASTELQPPAPSGFIHAQPLDKPEPAYPDQARGNGLAVVRATVDLDISSSGRVLSADVPFLGAAKLIPKDLSHLFEDAARKAARGTRFQPATRDGVPVEDKVRLVYEMRE